MRERMCVDATSTITAAAVAVAIGAVAIAVNGSKSFSAAPRHALVCKFCRQVKDMTANDPKTMSV